MEGMEEGVGVRAGTLEYGEGAGGGGGWRRGVGVRTGTLEYGEVARGGGMEEWWESGLEPWSVGGELRVDGWRRGGSQGWIPGVWGGSYGWRD